MHHNSQQKALSSRAVPLIIGGSAFVVPTAYAQAAPLDGLANAVSVASSGMFGLGCAVGAVVGGLAVGIACRGSRRRLQNELDEVVKIAERAEEVVRRAEALLGEDAIESLYGDMEVDDTSQLDRTSVVQRLEIEEKPQVEEITQIEEPEQEVLEEESVAQGTEVRWAASAAESTADATQASSVQATAQTTQDIARPLHQNRGVRALLRERLGSTDIFAEIPVIDRGAEREKSESVFVHMSRPKRQFDPAARASIIDRRIPRFDESLFPDVQSEQHEEVDVFETAMRAMEDSLSAVPMIESTADLESPEYAQPQGHPEVVDTQSYIEYLVQDELERNRSGQARRYSRAHLTMFDGTGDLNSARRNKQYRPRHMQPTSKEA